MAKYYVQVYDGASSSGINLNEGYMYVSGGGSAFKTTVNSGSFLGVYNSGSAASTTVNSGGSLYVSKGGQAIYNTINSGGSMHVSSGGEAASTTVNKGGYQSVYYSGTVISTTVNSGGKLYVSSGGTAINTAVNSGGELYVSSATATGITVNSGGSIYVSSGGTAKYTTVYAGSMYLSSGGTASNTVVNSGGKLYVSSGTVNSTTVNSGGTFVLCGGTATTDTQVNFGGELDVASGATATEITVTEGGRLGLTVASNTYIQGTSDGSAFLMKNAYLSGHTLNSGGSLDVASGGTATNTTVNYCCHMTVSSGGTATNTRVNSGGSLAVSKGKVTGPLTIANGAKVTMDTGSILDFDISKRTTGSPVLVNNLSLVSGSPDCTITVSSDQAAGVYSLAGGAAGFGGKFTIGTDGANYGTVTVNGNVLTHGSKTYTLKVAGSTLQLTVAGKSTPAPTPAAFTEDLGVISIGKNVNGSLGYNGNIQDNASFTVGTTGTYRVDGNFGTLNASVTISSGNKAVASGTIKNGVLTFNKGNPVMLAPGNYSLALKSSDKGKTASNYTFAVKSVKLFNKGDNDSQAAPHQLGSVASAGTLVADGWVGFGDEFDYYAFTLDHAANLVLDYTSTDAAKFTVYNENGKSLMNSSVKANVPLSTKAKLFQSGTYYLAVQSTNAKKGGDADFTVKVNGNSFFFSNGYNGDDTPATATNSGIVTKPGLLNLNWVGVGDEFDYQKFTLNAPAKLNFTINSSNPAKFTVYQLNEKGKLKSLGNVSVKAGTANTKDIFADVGTYYLSMQSTTAKKDGNAFYSVKLNDNSKFYTEGDGTNDTWQAASGQVAKLEGEEISGWVGFGDASDFIKFEIAEKGKIQLTLDEATKTAFASKQIKLSCLDANGKSVAIALDKNDPFTMLSKKDVDVGKYYLGVTCANVKKYDTYYSIKTGQLAC